MSEEQTIDCNETEPVPCEDHQTRGWYAWNNRMPGGPGGFHVVGEVEVGNPGIIAILTPKVPQGINPQILLLDLHLRQRPGVWPRVVTWAGARFDSAIPHPPYTQVVVFCGDKEIAHIPVEDVH